MSGNQATTHPGVGSRSCRWWGGWPALLCAAAALELLPALHALGDAPGTYYERQIRSQGISPDVEGIRRYLQLLNPSEQQRKHARSLVKALGHPDFHQRESATRQLVAMPHAPLDELKQASRSSDPEVRFRAKAVLKVHATRDAAVLHAVLLVVAEKPLRGLAGEILEVFGRLERPYGTRLGVRALKATAEKKDARLLLAALRRDDAEARAAVVETLPMVLGEDALATLQPLLGDETQPAVVSLAAARVFAEAGRREALGVLVRLLASAELSVRAESALLLRALTGQRFGFAAYDTAANRENAVRKWKDWLATGGKTAALRHPLKPQWGDESYLNGHTLLAYGYGNKVVELDESGKEIWRFDMRGIFGAEKLPSGNVLVSTYGPNEVLEVSPQNKVVWRMKVPSCLNARQLPSGNILIACHTAKQVWEVTREKQVVWKYTGSENCYDAHRLPNGNTLIASEKGIVEITPAGKRIWEYPAAGLCYGFQPLPNGHLLIAGFSSGTVTEVTRDGRIVWSFKLPSAFDVVRLPNGNTLATSYNRFVEVTKDGRVLWSRTGNQYGRARK